MKLVIVGGGSSYTPELVEGLIQRHAIFPVRELVLMDINPQRLEIAAGLSQRMLNRAGVPVRVWATTDRRRALEGADFVNCLIRVGGMDARIQDEKIPLKYNVIGQETTGPGGMMKALRTIPVMLELARDMVSVCPDAWLINYTNPSGIIAEALGVYGGRVRFVGLCSLPAEVIRYVTEALGADPSRVTADWMGLNHLGFLVRLTVDGQDRLPEIIEMAAQRAEENDHGIAGDWLRALGMLPASYLRYYYHHTAVVREAQKPGHRTRGEIVKEMEAELWREYSDPTLDVKPALLSKRGGGGYADVAFAAMLAILGNTGERQVTQVLNQGAITGLPDDASVEVPCRVDAQGAHPIPMGELPLAIRGLVQAVKSYETLTVRAAVEGSRRLALQALMAHPLVPSYDEAAPMLEELLAANKQWIPWA